MFTVANIIHEWYAPTRTCSYYVNCVGYTQTTSASVRSGRERFARIQYLIVFQTQHTIITDSPPIVLPAHSCILLLGSCPIMEHGKIRLGLGRKYNKPQGSPFCLQSGIQGITTMLGLLCSRLLCPEAGSVKNPE